MASGVDLDAALARIDALLTELGEPGEELAGILLALHEPAVEHLVTLPAVAADEAIAPILLLHGAHPEPLDRRVEDALDRIRPTMAAHAGGVEFLGIEAGVARLRLEGTCHGCPSSTATLRGLIETELRRAAPDLAGLDVQGLDAPADVEASIPLAPPRLKHATRADEEGHCQLCGRQIAADGHPHAVDIETRALTCVCRPCWLVLSPQGASQGRFRAVPERVLLDPTFTLGDATWDALAIPVSTVFFFRNSVLGRTVALYPSPAGATESLLALDAWDDVASANPIARELVDDVEALLVRRTNEGTQCFLAPIDVCYELVGRLRATWKGFDGGSGATDAIEGFFAALTGRAGVLEPAPNG